MKMKINSNMLKSDYWRSGMYYHLERSLKAIQPKGRGVEFGGSNGVIQGFCPSVQFETRYYPEYDVLNPDSWETIWDVVVMDQVIEHVKRPWEVFDKLADHTRIAVITLPFLALVHPCPQDYWRITPDAIRDMAAERWDSVEIGSWGNADAAYWLARYGFDMSALLANVPEEKLVDALNRNDENLPLMIWAILQK